MRNKVILRDQLNHLARLECSDGVTLCSHRSLAIVSRLEQATHHPSVVVPVGRIRSGFLLVENTRSLHLLGKGDKVGFLPLFQAPFLMCPEGTCGTNTGLHFVDNEKGAMFPRNEAKRAEEFRRRVLISAFGKDGLYDYSRDRRCGFTGQG